jgi:phospholipid transport system substrate-binding protein
LGRDWKKFNAAQQKEFMALFSALLEGVYLDRIIAYTDEQVVFGNESMLRKDRAEVQSKVITKSNTEVPLFYRMVEESGQWRVYDVIIEGVSMIKNYRSQFGEILSKQTPQDLLKILRDKTGKA